MIEATHKIGNFATSLARASDFMTLSQGSSAHEEYMERVKTGAIAMLHDFGSKDPKHAGYIKLDDLTTAIYLKGVDGTMFTTKIDDIIKEVSKSHDIPNPYDTMNSFQRYKTTRMISKPSADLAYVATQKSPVTGAAGCELCISYGRTENAQSHTLGNCRLNRNSPSFSTGALHQAEKQRERYNTRKAAAKSPNPAKALTKPAKSGKSATAHAATAADPTIAYIAALSKMSDLDREASMAAVAEAECEGSDDD